MVAERRAEAELRAYVDAHGDEPPADLAGPLRALPSNIGAAKAELELAVEGPRQVDTSARAFKAELDRLEERHRRAVMRLAKQFGRAV